MKNFLTNLNSLNVPFTLNLGAGVGFKNNDGSGCFSGMKYYNAPFDIPWDTTNCAYMFSSCNSFDSPLNIREETPIINMYGMFRYSVNFNQEVTIPTTCTNWQYILDGYPDNGCLYENDVHVYAPHNGSRYANVGDYSWSFYSLSRFNGNVIFHHPVINMADAFAYCGNLNRPQRIPRGVNNIAYMYQSCYRFNNVLSVPNTVDNACGLFYACYNLRRATTLPDDIDAQRAYYGCENLNAPVRIPSHSNISYFLGGCRTFNQPLHIPAFRQYDEKDWSNAWEILTGCHNFNASVTFDDSITALGPLFSTTNFNRSVTLPSSLKYDDGIFSGAQNFNAVPIYPSGVLVMNRSFASCWNFNQSVLIPSTVKNMHMTFYSCSNFNKPITVPSGVEQMAYTFSGCSVLNQSISLPSGVKTTVSCFSGCRNFNYNVPIPSSCEDAMGMFSGCYNYYVSNATIPAYLNNFASIYYDTKVSNITILSGTFNSYDSVVRLVSTIDTSGKTPSNYHWNYQGDINSISWGDTVATIRINGSARFPDGNSVRQSLNLISLLGGVGYWSYNDYVTQWKNRENRYTPGTDEYYHMNKTFNLGQLTEFSVSTPNSFVQRLFFGDLRNATSNETIKYYSIAIQWT